MPAATRVNTDDYSVSHKTLTDLTPDPRNANKGSQRGNAMIADSLRDYGAGRSILLDKHGRIIAGNKTAENAGAAGLADVIVVQSDGTKLIAVQRMDLDLDDPKAKQLAIADNRAGQVSLDWDIDVLKELSTEIDLAPFWSVDELEKLWPHNADLLTDEDAVPDLPEEPVTKPGDLYILGRHRLLCGDSTCVADVERLMGGEKVDMILTDPPYGIGYEYASHKDGDAAANAQLVADVFSLYECGKVWTPGLMNLARDISRFGPAKVAVWHKKFAQAGNGLGGASTWEPVLILNPPSKALANDVLVIMTDRAEVGGVSLRDLHSCPKPVGLYAALLEAFTAHRQIVAEPFCGSGTTLIACEKTGRSCYGMEIDPRYCDVICQRWQDATGQKAVLDGAAA